MAQAAHFHAPTEPEELEEFGHPRGTLAIVGVFGLLFALGWVAMFVFRFLGHGAPHAH